MNRFSIVARVFSEFLTRSSTKGTRRYCEITTTVGWPTKLDNIDSVLTLIVIVLQTLIHKTNSSSWSTTFLSPFLSFARNQNTCCKSDSDDWCRSYTCVYISWGLKNHFEGCGKWMNMMDFAWNLCDGSIIVGIKSVKQRLMSISFLEFREDWTLTTYVAKWPTKVTNLNWTDEFSNSFSFFFLTWVRCCSSRG